MEILELPEFSRFHLIINDKVEIIQISLSKQFLSSFCIFIVPILQTKLVQLIHYLLDPPIVAN